MVLPTLYDNDDGIKINIIIIYILLIITFILGSLLCVFYIDSIVFTTPDLPPTSVPYYNAMPVVFYPSMQKFSFTWMIFKSVYITIPAMLFAVLFLVIGFRRPYSYPICIAIIGIASFYHTVLAIWEGLAWVDSQNNFWVISRTLPLVITNKNVESLYIWILQLIIGVLGWILLISCYSLKLLATKLVVDERENGAIAVGENAFESDDE
jgi:hypothetical protein